MAQSTILPASYRNPSGTIGSGSDTIVLTMSEDADGPAGAVGSDAEFTLNIDGQQIGGLQTVTASHSAGQTETFTFQGNFGLGPHKATVTFANNSMTGGDKAAFNDGGDRNVYVNGVVYDGATVSSTVTGIYESPFFAPMTTDGPHYGNAVFTLNDNTAVPANAPSTPSTTPASVSAGTGPDTLALTMSEDRYQTDAQFSVTVDGKLVANTLTASAIEYEGQTQQFLLHGNWGNGPHDVSIAFLNDGTGPADARGTYDLVDRNLFINAVSYDGTVVSNTPWGIFEAGAKNYSVPTTSAPVSAPALAPVPVSTPAPQPAATSTAAAPTFATQAIHNKTDLLTYLKSIEGKGIISGQYIANNTSYNEIQTIQANTGKSLGSIGIDYYWYGQTGTTADTSANANAINWWNNGGLVVLTTHMGTPSLTPSGGPANGGVYDVPGQSNPFTGTIDWNALVQTGTAVNAKLNGFLDSIANGIYDLAKSGVTVIYRPYHESDGGWFWWGTGSGDGVGGANPTSSQFTALWRYTHDYISNKAGPNGQTLGNNIAWAFTGVGETNGKLNNYPDDSSGKYVDIVGDDLYSDTPGSDTSRYNAEVATGKSIIVAEAGPNTAPFDETKMINAFKTVFQKAVLFQQWDSSSWGIDYMQNAKAALSDPYVLNRGMAPTSALMPTPTPVPTTIAVRVSEDAYQGDAQFTVNVDGKQVGGTYSASALHASGDSMS